MPTKGKRQRLIEVQAKYVSPTKTFARRVLEARKAKGWSQKTLAFRAGYHHSHIRKIEDNVEHGYNSQIQTVFDLALALSVSPSYLLGIADETF